MKNWNFDTWLKVVIIPSIITILGAVIGGFLGSKLAIDQRINNSHGGDIQIKAGDANATGNGGSLNVGPGRYRAGDAVQR